MTLSWRPLTREDVPAITALTNRVIAAEGTGRPITAESVAEQFTAPRFDAATDSIGVVDDGGGLVAVGTVWVIPEPVDGRAMVRPGGDVDPDHRGRGIGRELLAWLETRGEAAARERHPGLPVRFRTPGGTPGSATERLLQAAGYQLGNSFLTMEAELRTAPAAVATAPDGTVPDGTVPDGTPRVSALDDALLRATRDAHNDAFRDHRNSSEIPEDDWLHWTSSPSSRTDLGRVVVDGGGRVLAYALVSTEQPEVAHIELVGTRREARGRGLARAVLGGALAAAREAELEVAELEVDATSPTGADRLYTSLGFVPVRTITRYSRDV